MILTQRVDSLGNPPEAHRPTPGGDQVNQMAVTANNAHYSIAQMESGGIILVGRGSRRFANGIDRDPFEADTSS